MFTPVMRNSKAVGLTRLFVVLGLVLRMIHYFRDPSVWHDEAALIVNVLHKSFQEQLGHLTFDEAAPPLFLWSEKLVALVFGESTLALRLLPFLASCLGLILFTWVAFQVLKLELVPWAVSLVAFSDRLLWHTCEAKPYALDIFWACALPALFIATRQMVLTRRLLLFVLVSPIVIWSSFPGSFLVGGVILAFIPDLLKFGHRRAWFTAILLVTTIGLSFLTLSLGPVRAQRTGPMESCWLHAFASWDRPWTIPWWSVKSSVEMVDYCFRPAGGILSLFALAGIWCWTRIKAWDLLGLFLVPIVLAWFAACLRCYPFTGARVIAYTMPALALLIAMGVPVVIEGTQKMVSRTLAFSGTAILFAPPMILALIVGISPWSRTEWNDAMDYLNGRLLPTDHVASNAWESSYYFRDLGNRYVAGNPTTALSSNQRLWILIKADTEADRRKVLQEQFGVKTPIQVETQFPGVSVFFVGQGDEVATNSKP